MNNITNEIYWNKFWSKKSNRIEFKKLFQLFLPKIKGKSCLEIGCAPGRYLIYLNTYFKYSISGLDFCDVTHIKTNFRNAKIHDYVLYNVDFNKFKTKKHFDVVLSLGFLEHFKNYETIFNKHSKLLSKKGILFLELPNFRNLQGYFRKKIDSKNMDRHNLEVMDLEVLRELCKKNKLKILFCDYYQTADFWIDPTEHNQMLVFFINVVFSSILKIISYLIDVPNKYTSPYIVLVAKK